MFSYQIFVRCDVYAVYLVVGHETLYPLDLGSQFSTYSTRGRVVNADFCLLRPQLCVTQLTTMNRSAAEENLRVIRELMERATIYRAVSAPGALFCGLSALLVSARALIPGPFQALFQHNFALVWIVVCLLSVTANIFFLVRATELRQERFASYRLRTALLAIAPAFIVAIALTFFLTRAAGTELFIAVCWMALYGRAPLSTMKFSPRSIAILGWAFFLTTLLILSLLPPLFVLPFPPPPNH